MKTEENAKMIRQYARHLLNEAIEGDDSSFVGPGIEDHIKLTGRELAILFDLVDGEIQDEEAEEMWTGGKTEELDILARKIEDAISSHSENRGGQEQGMADETEDW
jgi:hypothetical protein